MYAFLADSIVALHFAMVAFCVAGEAAILTGAVFKWRWIRSPGFRAAHLFFILYVAGESILGVTCPLTDWEYRLRLAAGQRRESDLTFVAQLLRRVIFYDFPPWVFTTMYVVFGLIVLLTFIFVPPRRKSNP